MNLSRQAIKSQGNTFETKIQRSKHGLRFSRENTFNATETVVRNPTAASRAKQVEIETKFSQVSMGEAIMTAD